MSVTKIKTFTRNVLPAPETKSRKKGRKASGKAPLKTLKVPPKKMSIGAKSSKAANIIARDATINGTTTEGKRHHTKRMPLFTAGDIASPPTAVEGVEKYDVEITECVKLKKVIKRIKFYDQLHGHFGYPKPLKDDTMYAYVLRRYNAPVPLFECYKEAEAEMPGYFLVGTFNGRFPRCIYYTLKTHYLCIRDCFMDPSYAAMEESSYLKHPDDILRNMMYPAELLTSPTHLSKLLECQGVDNCLVYMKSINKVLMKKKILKLKEYIQQSDLEHISRYKIDQLITKQRKHDVKKMYSLRTILTGDVKNPRYKDVAHLFLEARYNIYVKRKIDPLVEFAPIAEPFKIHLLESLNEVINAVSRYTETKNWSKVILSSADVGLFALINKHGLQRKTQLKILEEDARFGEALIIHVVPWTNYISNICNLLENTDLSKNILQLYYASENTYMIIWPILAHVEKTATTRNIVKILKCVNPNLYMQFIKATKRLRLNFRRFYYTALFMRPFLEDIKMLTASENLNSLENTWANLNTFSTMLRTFYTKGHLNFNQLTSLEETEKFSVASIVLNIHEKLAPMFIRVCEKLFYESWPKLKLKCLERLCKKIPKLLTDYKEYVDIQFYDFIYGRTTERQQYTRYIDSVREHCLRLSIMAKVLRYFKHIFGTLFPTLPRMMVYQNMLKSSLRDIMTQLFTTRLNIFEVNAEENAAINEWFWTAIRQLSVLAIDVIDLTFENLASSLRTLKYLKYHEKTKIQFFLRDELMSKYPKIMDKYIEEANEFHDILVRCCPHPPRIKVFPFYTNRLYYLRFIASASYGIFKRITKVPEVANSSQTVLGEKWKNYNVQKAANLEYLYIQQFIKRYKNDFSDICSTKCLQIFHKPGESADTVVGYGAEDLNKAHPFWEEGGRDLLFDHDLKFVINFDSKYYDLMSEVNQLQSLGYTLPEEFENILPHMKSIVKKLQVMSLTLNKNDKLYESLPRHHVTLLKPYIMPLDVTLRYACKSFTWGRSWLASWMKSVDQRLMIINKKNRAITETKKEINKTFKELLDSNFKFPREIQLPQKYFKNLERAKKGRQLFLRKCLSNITEEVVRLEWELYGTHTGSHELFAGFYNKVENTFRDCLVRSLINDLSQYKQWLDGNIISRFIIELEFVEGKMRTKPNMNLLHQLLANTLFGLVKCQSGLPRWLNYTAHPVPRVLKESCISFSINNRSPEWERPMWREETTQDRKTVEKLSILPNIKGSQDAGEPFAEGRNVIDRSLYRYSYDSHIITNKIIFNTILQIEKKYSIFIQNINRCQMKWTECLQVLLEQKARYERCKPTFAQSLGELEEIELSIKALYKFGTFMDVGCARLEFPTIFETCQSVLLCSRKMHLHTMISNIEFFLTKNYRAIKYSVTALKTELTSLSSFHIIMKAIDQIKNISNDVWWEFWKCNVEITTLELHRLFDVTLLKKLCSVMFNLWERAWVISYLRKY
ncbi:uncharacterized protein isoform X2 [Rhodnius prolixus]|uniref:uncharacterized protein isoform X2 n=1 Tax=Rhodnius prolixus TaxID=13249 RepID=UPI003D18A26C